MTPSSHSWGKPEQSQAELSKLPSQFRCHRSQILIWSYKGLCSGVTTGPVIHTQGTVFLNTDSFHYSIFQLQLSEHQNQHMMLPLLV